MPVLGITNTLFMLCLLTHLLPPQVPSGVLNRGEAAVLAGNLQRMPSGNIYDGFPCVRVGDFLLPSSMDLSAFLSPAAHLTDATYVLTL